MEKAILPLKEDIEELHRKLNAATEKALKDAANAADKAAEFIKKENELQTQLTLSQNNVETAEETIRSLTNVKETLKRKLEDSNERNEASAAETLNLEKKIQEYVTTQQNLEEKFDGAREQHGRIVADLEGNLDNVQKQLSTIVAENHDLRARNSALEKTEKDLQFQLEERSVSIEPSYEEVTRELANAMQEILRINTSYTQLIATRKEEESGKTRDSKVTESIEETKEKLDQEVQALGKRLDQYAITEGAPQYQPEEKLKGPFVLGPAKLIIDPNALKAPGAPKSSKASSTPKSPKTPTVPVAPNAPVTPAEDIPEEPDTNPFDESEDASDALEANASKAPAFADPSSTQLKTSLVHTWPGISPHLQYTLIAPPNTPIVHDPLVSDFFLKWATHPDHDATGVVEMLLPFEDLHYDDMTIPEPYDEEPDPLTVDGDGNPEHAQCSTCLKWYDVLDHECHKPLCLAFFDTAVR